MKSTHPGTDARRRFTSVREAVADSEDHCSEGQGTAQVQARYTAGLPKVNHGAYRKSLAQPRHQTSGPPGSGDLSRSSAQSRPPGSRLAWHPSAGAITERIGRLGTWPSPYLLHVCSAVAVSFDSVRYQAAAKWAESRTKRHRQALSGIRRTQNRGLLIRGFGVQVPGGAPVLTWYFC